MAKCTGHLDLGLRDLLALPWNFEPGSSIRNAIILEFPGVKKRDCDVGTNRDQVAAAPSRCVEAPLQDPAAVEGQNVTVAIRSRGY
jgi:hypothetical protein